MVMVMMVIMVMVMMVKVMMVVMMLMVVMMMMVDNLFVFVLLFEYFKVPPERQTRVLNYGIVGALVMRAIMVGAGVELIENFQPTPLVFAGILICSSYKLLAEGEEE